MCYPYVIIFYLCEGGTVGVGMRYGRKTCTKPLTNNKVQDLPGGDDPDAAEATRNMMGLSVRETTALLGNVEQIPLTNNLDFSRSFGCA